MFSSLLVVVILGAVTAQITRWCLVGAQPATVGLSSHRTGGMLPSLVGGDTGLRTDADEPVAVTVVEPVAVEVVEPVVVETTATSWVSRGRAVVGLTLVVSALGAVLAMAVASTALLTAAVLDSALG